MGTQGWGRGFEASHLMAPATDRVTYCLSLASREPTLRTLWAGLPFCGVSRADGAVWLFSGLLPAHCGQTKWVGGHHSRTGQISAAPWWPVETHPPCCSSGKSALLLDGSLCSVCPVRATAELSSPKPVTTMTQSTTTCSHGAEWNLLSYQAGLGLVTDQDRSSSLLPAPPFFCLFV